MIDTKLIKLEFSSLHDVHYFNTAYMGPYPKRTQKACQETIERYANPKAMDFGWILLPDKIRQQLQKVFGLNADNISIHSSTGEAISFLAMGYPFQSGDRVAVFKEEYPSDVLPWMFAARQSQKFEVDFYSKESLTTHEKLLKDLHPKTKVVNISHVEFQTGKRANIAEIGRALKSRGIVFVVDATQSLGGIVLSPEDINAVDLLVNSPYKWLLSPYGQAFAHWSSQLLEVTLQTQGNWMTQPTALTRLTEYSLESRPGACKFDRGQTSNPFGLNGLFASLTLFEEVGLRNIEKHNLDLVKYFVENLNLKKFEPSVATDLPSSIVTLRGKNVDSADLQTRLQKNAVDVSVREGNLRVSFHLFNTRAQVELLLKSLG